MKKVVLEIGMEGGSLRIERLSKEGEVRFRVLVNDSAVALIGEPPTTQRKDLDFENAESLADFLPAKYRDYRAHNDPEFQTFTYGDIDSPRAANLKKIKSGDQLWFLARLWEHDGERWTGKSDFFLIGRLHASEVFVSVPPREARHLPPKTVKRIENNAHWSRFQLGDARPFTILVGDQRRSTRFRRAIRVTPEIAGLIYGGAFDSSEGIYRSSSGEILTNKNGKPRRFENFGSITRSIQPFLDSEDVQQGLCITKLEEIATQAT